MCPVKPLAKIGSLTGTEKTEYLTTEYGCNGKSPVRREVGRTTGQARARPKPDDKPTVGGRHTGQ
jgi:hypothetical protein